MGPGIGRKGGPGRLEPTEDDFWSARTNNTIYKARMNTVFGALELLEKNRKRISVVFCKLFCTRHETPRFTCPSRCLPRPFPGIAARRSSLVLMLLLPPEPLRMPTASPARALLIIA